MIYFPHPQIITISNKKLNYYFNFELKKNHKTFFTKLTTFIQYNFFN